MSKRVRNFCFTINNYENDDLNGIKEAIKVSSYIIIGYEGKDKTPHIQGYCELEKQTAFSKIKAMLPRAHIEQRKGTAQQAADYCKKEGNFKEHGNISKAGTRTDLKNLVLNQTNCIKQLLDNNQIISHQQLKFAESLLKYSKVKRNPDEPINVHWIHGESGSGKSRLAYKSCKDPYIWRNSQGKWFDGYDGDDELILDDLRPNDINWTSLLAIMDRYPCKVEFKGGSRELTAKTVIITSILSPEEFHKKCWTSNQEPLEQLTRRITKITRLLKGVYSEVEGNTITSTSTSQEK